ncbi:MAG TPA: long-chain fatty acid--CoA ligase [Candidatus Krumholzibacteria bacterium]|nr:long-chain fatty acid--CoA ligase [Candidatus Krumholzibacteria bacterium]HRX51701.1 long-chain fatty acid--CoA ligase [Candidatus Krumholzibacteria bacterium]
MSVQTIPQLFFDAVAQRPRPDMFSAKDAGGTYRDISSEEMQRRVRAVRLGLDALGVGRGDRVAILSENRVEWALTDLAALALGAVDVPIYPTLLPETIEYILKDCEPKAVFVSNAEQAGKIDEIRAGLPFLTDVISYDAVAVPNVMTFAKLEQMGASMAEKLPQSAADEVGPAEPEDLCSIIYTSGTTGNPKGVMLSHWNFVSNVLDAVSLIDIGTEDKVLSFLPLSHVFERMAGYYTMVYAGTGIAYAEGVDTVADDMGVVKPTVMVSVPRLYEKIYDKVNAAAMSGGPAKRTIFGWAKKVGKEVCHLEQAGGTAGGWLKVQQGIVDRLVFSKLRARTGGRLRFFVSGGAPLAVHINEFFYAAGLTVLEGYGLTETSPVISVNTFERNRIGSVGPVIPSTEVRIADDGEILARGPGIMLGYYNNPEATAETIDEEGWLHTGDIGHLDKEGYLFITDRKKDILVTAGGKNVAPQPIENQLKKNKFIGQVVVVGDRRPYLACLIVPNFEELEAWAKLHHVGWSDHAELLAKPEVLEKFQRGLDRANAKLPSFGTIKRFGLVKDEFTLERGELTPTLKVKRNVIQREYADLIDRMYAQEA